MTTLHTCLNDLAGKLCGGRVVWTRSIAGGFAGECSRCRDQRRAVSGELPVLEQLEADGGLTPAQGPGQLTPRPKGRSPDTR